MDGGSLVKKNRVQFQAGMSLMTFLDRYGTEAQCREVLAKARWPDGFRCPDCGHAGHCHLAQRDVYQCNRCKRQVSLTGGTLFARPRLPLRTWSLAVYLMTRHKNGISALALRRPLGVSYNTAWPLKHKLMQAMVERDSDQALGGIVQMDDACWGGERHGGGTCPSSATASTAASIWMPWHLASSWPLLAPRR
jgi:transposase-like protein